MVLTGGMLHATRQALATLPPGLAPHARVVRRLGRGFTNLLAIDTSDPVLFARARALAPSAPAGFDNPLCVTDENLGGLDELPPGYRPDATP